MTLFENIPDHKYKQLVFDTVKSKINGDYQVENIVIKDDIFEITLLLNNFGKVTRKIFIVNVVSIEKEPKEPIQHSQVLGSSDPLDVRYSTYNTNTKELSVVGIIPGNKLFICFVDSKGNYGSNCTQSIRTFTDDDNWNGFTFNINQMGNVASDFAITNGGTTSPIFLFKDKIPMIMDGQMLTPGQKLTSVGRLQMNTYQRLGVSEDPQLLSISPASPQIVGSEITVNGSNLIGDIGTTNFLVIFPTEELQFKINNSQIIDNSFKIKLPSNLYGWFTLIYSIQNLGVNIKVSNSIHTEVIIPPNFPKVDSIEPNKIDGKSSKTLTIKGTNLKDVKTVYFFAFDDQYKNIFSMSHDVNTISSSNFIRVSFGPFTDVIDDKRVTQKFIIGLQLKNNTFVGINPNINLTVN